jgi:exosome complex component RRP4
MSEENVVSERILVIPGEELGDTSFKPGTGTYKIQNKIFASQVGIKNIRAGYINVIPLSGRYIPRPTDSVVGVVEDLGPSNWMVRINSPYSAFLHVSETPWNVEYGNTGKFLSIGDTVLAKILHVDESKRVQLTLKEHGLRKLNTGQVVNVSHAKVPRIIGKAGSMISLLKEYTGCRIFVGQNGAIWIDGDTDKIIYATMAIEMIEKETQTQGLTDAVREFLKGLGLEKQTAPAGQPAGENCI